MSDSLLASCGLLSPSVAGQALALDSMDLEQQRQMTINSANVTLYYELDGTPYVINMIDTPGHIDFTGRVTRALRAIDGAVVVCDAVEGIMTQTETVTRQALEERVRPVLYINKIDRLIKELRLTPDKMQEWISALVSDFNKLIEASAEPEYREKWKVSIQDSTVAFGSVYDAYQNDDVKSLIEKLPLHEAVLRMVIRHFPPPDVAQKYRIPKIWKGDLDSDIGKAIQNCDENGPITMMVTNIVVDPAAGTIAIGRLFSGTVKDGSIVHLIDAKRECRVQSVSMFMGAHRDLVGSMPSGNIPALLGLENARAGETISSSKGVLPFESIKYVSEPVVTIAIESKHPKDLPKLVDVLRRIALEDPNLVLKIQEETGEMLLAGMGVLHLEIATSLIQEAQVEIITSEPLINYRESIRSAVGPIMARSPNRHNKIYFRVEPLSKSWVYDISELHLGVGNAL